MTRKIASIIAIASIGLTSPAAILLAQKPQVGHASSSGSSAGPTVSASVAGIRPAATASAKTTNAPAAEPRLGAGRNVALMVVGGAALIIGAVIGGTAGVLIAVTGAALGLYGLYNFVQ